MYAAERLIVDQGYDPINVEPVPSMFSLEEALPTLFKVKQGDVVVFSRQLATLLRSGISLLPALEVICFFQALPVQKVRIAARYSV